MSSRRRVRNRKYQGRQLSRVKKGSQVTNQQSIRKLKINGVERLCVVYRWYGKRRVHVLEDWRLAQMISYAKAKQQFEQLPKKIKKGKAKNLIKMNQEEAWSMTREAWNNNKKYYGINWYNEKPEDPTDYSFIPDWEMTEKAEMKAINDYFGTHKDIYKKIYNDLGEIEPLKYEDDRDWDFANSDWSMQVKCNIKDSYRNDVLWKEDAREAIILGRRLGYHENDILTYVIRNYIPDLYEIMLEGKKIPNKYIELYPNIER